jgi:hypothetical protein
MFTSFLHGQDTHLHAPHIYTQHTRAIQKPLSPTSLPLHDISQENEKDIILITNTKLHKKIINNYPNAYFPSAHSCDNMLSSPTSECYSLRSHKLSILRVLNNEISTTREKFAIALQWRKQISIFGDG